MATAASVFMESKDYFVDLVTPDQLFVSDGSTRIYFQVTEQLKEQLTRICEGWAFESEIRGREMAGEVL